MKVTQEPFDVADWDSDDSNTYMQFSKDPSIQRDIFSDPPRSFNPAAQFSSHW